MSMQSMERQIVAELREITGKPKLRIKDMQEWSTGTMEKTLRPNEKLIHCPKTGVYAAVLKTAVGE